MHAEVFLDTNVILYAASTDPAERGMHERARQLSYGTVRVLNPFLA